MFPRLSEKNTNQVINLLRNDLVLSDIVGPLVSPAADALVDGTFEEEVEVDEKASGSIRRRSPLMTHAWLELKFLLIR